MEEHVLMYLDEGMVELTENNHTTRLTSGDCAFIRKDCNVMMNKKCIDGKPFMATFLTFKRSFLQETFRSFDKATLPSNARRSNNSVIKLPNNRPGIKSLFDSLFDFKEPWKIDILEFMNRNFRYDLLIKQIANYTGRSLSTFKRDFKKLSPLTPERWIMQRRLEEARKLLEHCTKKISDICFAVGFKNLSHFSKAYKQMYGTSPIKNETN